MKLKNLWLIAVAILIYACNAEETRSWEVTFDPNKPKDPNEQSIINVAAGKFYKTLIPQHYYKIFFLST